MSFFGGLLAGIAQMGMNAVGQIAGSRIEQHEARKVTERELGWKVKAARDAGLHPLFALGGSGSYSPTIRMGDESQALGSAITRGMESNEERVERQMRLALLRSQAGKDDAMAAYYGSEAARNAQAMMQGAPLPKSVVTPMGGQGQPYFEGMLEMKADPQYSRDVSDPSSGAAYNPLWMKHQMIDPETRRKYGLPSTFERFDTIRSEEGASEGMEGFLPQVMAVIRNLLRWNREAAMENAERLRPQPHRARDYGPYGGPHYKRR